MLLHEARKFANDRKAIFDNPKQIEISEKYLVDIMPEFSELMLDIRHKIDETFFRKIWINKWEIDYSKYEKWLKRNNKFYPIWFCNDIRNRAFSVLNSWKFDLINKLKNEWTIFKQIYWTYDMKYFQNAIQIGDYYLDVSNDTVDPSKEKIDYSRLNESLFRNFSNYSDYCDVIESYRKAEVFPNIYFTEIAFSYPFFVLHNGKIEFIWHHVSLMFSDAINWFKDAMDFIFNSKYSNKRLNDEQLEILKSYSEKLLEKWVKLNINEITRNKTNINPVELNDNILRHIIWWIEKKRKIVNDLEINLWNYEIESRKYLWNS